jgi:acyl-coenzyme A thioesterase PaaI-like protein
MAPAIEDTELIAEAKVIQAMPSLVAVEGTVVDETGRLILKSTGSFIIDRKYPAVWELKI